jgi:hypothetical protein
MELNSKEQILAIFKQSIVSFMDELIDQFPRETGLILARIFLKDQIPIQVTMHNFIAKIEKDNGLLKRMIKNRNEVFFLENNVFSVDSAGENYALSGGTVNHFRNLWLSDLDKEDRNTIWKWFESFAAMAKKYQEAWRARNRHSDETLFMHLVFKIKWILNTL